MPTLPNADPRWEGYVPWFLLHQEFNGRGNFSVFFERVAHRLRQLVLYDGGPALANSNYFAEQLESRSHQRFRFNSDIYHNPVHAQIETFFIPGAIEHEIHIKLIQNRQTPQIPQQYEERQKFYLLEVIKARITVLEAVLYILSSIPTAGDALSKLRRDLRAYLAEAGIMLDIEEHTGLIVPIEEPLLQGEVIDRLLPRLAARFPDLERDLIKAYHDLLQGVDGNTVFCNAFKVLEELARRIIGEKVELHKETDIGKHFPRLHRTILITIVKLAGHRGDEGAHFREGPDVHEMRYLLFAICNIALLFLDYPSPTNNL